MKRKLLDRLKYYTLDKPILYLMYIAVGTIILLYMFISIEVPIYTEIDGVIFESNNNYVITLEQNISRTAYWEKIYVYTNDMDYLWIITDYTICKNKIWIKSNEISFLVDKKIKLRFKIGSESLFSKLIVRDY